MSVHVTSLIWKSTEIQSISGNHRITPGQKLILLQLADNSSHDGSAAYSSLHRISQETGIDHRWVRRYIQLFVSLGALSITEPEIKGTNQHRKYRLNFPVFSGFEGYGRGGVEPPREGAYRPLARGHSALPNQIQPELPYGESSNLDHSGNSEVVVVSKAEAKKATTTKPEKPSPAREKKRPVPVPALLIDELLGKPLSPTGEWFELDQLEKLFQNCRAEDRNCTAEEILEAVGRKIRVNHHAKRPVHAWVAFLQVAVPRAIRKHASVKRVNTSALLEQNDKALAAVRDWKAKRRHHEPN